ncbi:PURPLE ACID PHOSPHATASE [Salix purpurea]|uniref:Purple acid phosphatase n=1 Tax=Salix purpurea TaxID=77065 RepID=A0A9Q0Z1Z9_SALPP|nr:PURPLE ACID PHOSPHATASE [Salix purpurea]
MRGLELVFFAIVLVLATLQVAISHGEQPLSRIAVHNTRLRLSENADIRASPSILGFKGQNSEWVTLEYASPNPSNDDWIGVFSPADFSASTCNPDEGSKQSLPFLCTAPIKYQYANYSSPGYRKEGKGSLRLQLINQRSDFSFVLFSGGLANPKVVAVSNKVAFTNPNAPVYPRLAQGKMWNEMTVTWTSGYGINEAEPFVEWGRKDGDLMRSPAGTLTFNRNSMCGAPARTVGWRDPGFIHTSFLKELWPNSVYTYKLGHKLFNGTYVWSRVYQFRASPYPGQSSVQRVVIFGDMGKDEADGSNEYNNYQRGSLNTTKQLIEDLKNIDIVFHIGDICYANGYLSQWDQFTAQVEPIASTVPYMIASGNHERDWPGTGSFYGNSDSGGECGTKKQPWLIFLAHRVLGYSSGTWYAEEGSFEEPMGRESLQKLWQKYKVDIAMYGHVHNYERTCPIYQNICTSKEKFYYKGTLNGTIHVVAGGGGASLADFTPINTTWSYFKDHDYGFVKLTAFDHSNLLFEYKKSRDGKVYDSFKISRDYRDILACTVDSCPSMTLAS